MRQLDIFKTTKKKKSSHPVWELYTDGASRNNPGPAAAGIYLLKNGKPVVKKSFYLGSKTNNEAEYLALLLGIYFLKELIQPGQQVKLISDSELMVRHCTGVYRVKKANLKPLYSAVKKMLKDIAHEFVHVLRSKNVQADKLANLGFKKKTPVPQEFITLLKQYDISE